MVSITPSGKRVYYWYGRVRAEPRPVEYKIGVAGKVTLSYARDEARKFNNSAAGGESPAKVLQALKQKNRASLTVGQVWDKYKAERLEATGRASTLRTDDSRYKLHLSAWARVRVGDITEQLAKDFHRELAAAKSPAIADKTLKLLRRMLTFAEIRPNPARAKSKENPSGVAFVGDVKRTRFLSIEELARLAIALENAANTTIADALRFALMTGARKSNICRARWSDMHLGQSLWIIPASESKNGKPMPIVLAPPAVDLLKRRRELSKKSPYVFPGRRPENPVTELKTTWDKIRTAAKIEDCRIHDLRHTLASHLAMNGTSLLAIGKQLGHANMQSTARYSHLDLAAIRPATAAAIATMFPVAAVAQEAGEAGDQTSEGKERGKPA